MSLLEATDLRGGYGGVDILNGTRLRVEAGEIVVVIGPNGAGKSTLMKALFGLVALRGGSVGFDGRDITRSPPDRLVPLGMSYVPQERNVFPSLTVSENLDMGAFTRRDDSTEERERIFGVFPDLRERRHTRAGQLSGGQRQMVAIGRALMVKPKLLMLDEPTAGLSPRFVDDIFERILSINALGVAVLMVEQNARRALEVADRGYVLVMGENRFEGRGRELLDDREVSEAFLGG